MNPKIWLFSCFGGSGVAGGFCWFTLSHSEHINSSGSAQAPPGRKCVHFLEPACLEYLWQVISFCGIFALIVNVQCLQAIA
jgi:hypothetical protein